MEGKRTTNVDSVITEQTTKPRKSNKKIYGIVTRCTRLNVRELASIESTVLGTIDSGCTVEIDNTNSTEEFYKISSEIGLDGYCKKEFIKIK